MARFNPQSDDAVLEHLTSLIMELCGQARLANLSEVASYLETAYMAASDEMERRGGPALRLPSNSPYRGRAIATDHAPDAFS